MRIKVDITPTGFHFYESDTDRQTYEFKYLAFFCGLEIDSGTFWGVDEDEVIRYVERKFKEFITD